MQYKTKPYPNVDLGLRNPPRSLPLGSISLHVSIKMSLKYDFGVLPEPQVGYFISCHRRNQGLVHEGIRSNIFLITCNKNMYLCSTLTFCVFGCPGWSGAFWAVLGFPHRGGFLLRVFGTQNDRIHVLKRGIFQTLRVGFSGVIF